ncbi:MAG TPA: hypothetical protein VGM56_21315 [Byssovorax sp.]
MPRFRGLAAFALALALGAGGCGARSGSPEAVADGFVDAYFRRMDQEKAKEYTALGATTALDKELADVADIRKDGYTPAEAAADVSVQRGASTPRDERVRVPYEVHIHGGAEHEAVRDADVELAKIDGTWKVVRFAVKSR